MRGPSPARLARAAAVLIAAAVGTSGALVALPAAAVTIPGALPSALKVVSGDRTLTAAWPASAGATAYRLRIATKPSLAHARTIVTAALTAQVPGLVNGKPYYLAVDPVNQMLTTTAAVKPAVVKAVAQAGVPFPLTSVAASPGATADSVRVDFAGGGRATKVAVIAGSNVPADVQTFHTGWYPATTRSITITVPPALTEYLGGFTGNPVWVKVVQSNSSSTAFGPTYDYARKYRPSNAGTWSFARAVVPAADVSRLKVGEFNVQSVAATASFHSVDQWSSRVGRVAAAINTADPDVLLTAELATNLVRTCSNTARNPYLCAPTTQVADLAKRLDGLTLAGSDVYARVRDEMMIQDSAGRTPWDGAVTDGAHVFYDPEKLTLLDHGYFAPALPASSSFGNVQGLGVPGWTGHNVIGPDRWLSWAKLRFTDSGRVFYAVAAHLPVGAAGAVVAARKETAERAIAAIERIAGTTPIVFGGDFNGDSLRNPDAAHGAFMLDGWFDAAAVGDKSLRTGMKVSTANGSGVQTGTDPGYNPKPIRHPWETTRIDYILLKNSPYTFRYDNVMRLNPDGTFVQSLLGSDHNMQLATVGIAGDPQPLPTAQQ